MIKAAIFDMDGLLLDSEPYWRQSWITLLKRYNIVVTWDEVRDMAGKGTENVAELWRQRYNAWPASDNATIIAELFQEVGHQIESDGHELPGATQLLTSLASRGVKLAVASSSPRFLIDAAMTRLGFDELLPVRESGTEAAHPKPAPDVFLNAARSLGVEPSECIVFEDAVSGITAAKAAGMIAIAVPEADADLTKYTAADHIISSLAAFDINTYFS